MKKRKPPEQPSPDFKHTPFRTLKGFAARSASSAHPAATPHRPENTVSSVDEDDASLFFRAVDGAKRIGSAEEKAAVPRQTAAERAETADPSDDAVFLQAMNRIGATLKADRPDQDEQEELHGRRSTSSRVKQLKRGTIRIGAELDLHGYLRDEALKQLTLFVSSAYQRGLPAVLVITGKGINSPEGPVLQRAVAEWLRMKGRGMVAEFGPAPRDRGGSGAYVVFLKKK